jgi:dienelactone hydrolase
MNRSLPRGSVHNYDDGGIAARGYLTLPEEEGKRPGILVVHEAPGLDDHVKRRAEMLAALGYVALAADLYGGGAVAASPREAIARARALREDPDLLRRRLRTALDALAAVSAVDPGRLGAIGYCFGGMSVLELARTGAPLAGVVSFHGVLETKRPAAPGDIKSKILVCTGAADPLVPGEQVAHFQAEMMTAGADWQVIAYGGAQHAFTNPAADSIPLPGFGYSRAADTRSWSAMKAFFDEAFET